MRPAIPGLLILLAAAACGPRPVPKAARPVERGYRLTLRTVPEDAKSAQAAGVRLERVEFYYDAVAPGKGGRECRLSGKGDAGFAWYGLTHVGEVEFLPSGKKRAFVVGTDAGSGLDSVYLSIVDAAGCAVSGLTIVTPGSKTHAQRLERWGPSHAADERAFLSDMKFRYGFEGKDALDAHKDNPKFAYRFWERDNGGVVDGPLKLRRYPGPPAQMGSIEARLADERYEFVGEFKAGVRAHDRKLDEHFVVFHPTTPYHWPTLILRTGRWLVIGTRGEGLAVVDLATWRLRRVRLEEDDDVRSLESVDGGVRVNAKRVVKL